MYLIYLSSNHLTPTVFTMKYSEDACLDGASRALPSNQTAPILCLSDIPENGVKLVEQIVACVAPQDKLLVSLRTTLYINFMYIPCLD